MAGRKRASAARSDDGQTAQPIDDTGPGDIAVSEEFTDSGPATPTGKIRVRGSDDEPRARFAGHVLTDRGWVLER